MCDCFFKKKDKKSNDRMIAYWGNKYNCQQNNCETFMNKEGKKNFDFASPFFPIISIFMLKKIFKKN